MQLIRKYQDIFYLEGDKLTVTPILKLMIPTTDDIPVSSKPFRLPPTHREEINRQVDELLENGIIEPSTSPWCSPCFLVPKPEDMQGNKRYRMVIDYRKVNEKTIADNYPLRNITEILDQLNGAKYFSVFDLKSSYHQIEIDEKHRYKTAFSTTRGLWHFCRGSFGLKTMPATFSRALAIALAGLIDTELFCYLDDIIVHSKTFDEHLERVEHLFERLRATVFKIQPEKCEFFKSEVVYLGHVITTEGLRPNQKILNAVRLFPTPSTPKHIKMFMGLAGFYRRFIKDFSKIGKPLTNLLQKDIEFKWTDETQEAFEIIKNKLCEAPLLIYPDFSKEFNLTTDASGFAIGAILSQGPIGRDNPVAYYSRVMTTVQRRYDTFNKEGLALVYSIKHFRPYLLNKRFNLITDHRALVWMQTHKEPNSRIMRWRIELAEYDFKIIYRPGSQNPADALSRNPVVIGEQTEDQRLDEDDDFYVAEPSQLREDGEERIDQYLTASNDCDFKPVYILTRAQTKKRAQQEIEPARAAETIPSRTLSTVELPAAKTACAAELPQQLEAPIPPKRRGRPRKVDTIDKQRESDKINSVVQDNAKDVGMNNGSSAIVVEREEPENMGIELNSLFDNTKIDCDVTMNNNSEDAANLNIKQIIMCREKLFMRRDNYLYLIDSLGEPCDEGAKQLKEMNKLPHFKNIEIAEPLKIKVNKKYHIALPLRGETPLSLFFIDKNLDILFGKLREILVEMNIESISMAKSDYIENLEWSEVFKKLKNLFTNNSAKLIICLNMIKYPIIDDRDNIIQEAHASAIGGHRGITKTFKRIKHNFYWENLKEDVQNFIRNCLDCQLKKLVRVRTRQPMHITDSPRSAFEKIAMDIVGPLKESKKGNMYILTFQDLFSKFAIAEPLQTTTAIDVANGLIKKVICVFGAPKIILTDRGQNFMSSLMKRVAKRFRISQVHTSSYRPQSNGALERSHASLIEFLKFFVQNNKRDWDEYIEMATFNFNTSVSESTWHTPFELVFGKLARTPANYNIEEEDLVPTYQGYMKDLITRLSMLHKIARDNLIKSKIKSKEYYDQKVNEKSLKIGEYVFLLRGPKPSKFEDRYTGPHRVLDILSNENVKIQIAENKTKIVHANRLRKSYIEIEE